MTKSWDFIQEPLQERKKKSLLRQLRTLTPINGVEVLHQDRKLINFSSNDYLGLSVHPALQEAITGFTQKYGSGATASRLVCGTFPCHEAVESKLAALKGSERALIFNSGFQANVTLFPTLAGKNALLLVDKLAHNSILQGTKLSPAKTIRFQHNNLEHLEKLLQTYAPTQKFSPIFIATESVFSMDGDRSDIDALIALAEKYGAFLVIDEAHATGVLGKKGMGLTAGKNIDLTMGTFGKGCGSFGAYIACSAELADYLINFCPGFIYTTALPPAVIGAIDAALDLIPSMEPERRRLLENAAYLRENLNGMGYETGNSSTQIIPVILGGEEETVTLSNWLEENNILAIPIRPPTVPPGKARIRLTLSALHTRTQIDFLLTLFKKRRSRR